MVLPALMMLAGSGLQMYGQDKQTAAQSLANTQQGNTDRIIGQGQNFADQQYNDAVAGLQNKYNTATGDLVNKMGIAPRMQALQAATAQGRGGIDDVLGQLGEANNPLGQPGLQGQLGQSQDMSPENIMFATQLARERDRVAAHTNALAAAQADKFGIAGLNAYDGRAHGEFDNQASTLGQRLQALQRLYSYASATRQAGMQRAGDERAMDNARAASAGAGPMYLGALMGGAGAAWGAVQQGRQNDPNTSTNVGDAMSGNNQGTTTPGADSTGYGGNQS